MKYLSLALIIFTFLSCSDDEMTGTPEGPITSDRVVWTGPVLTFEKMSGDDPTDAANQDRITDSVWITRDNDGGQIFNIAQEEEAVKETSPAGTLWAEGELSDIANLTFEPFRTAVERPQLAVGKKLVMLLVEENICLSVEIKSWDMGQMGGFSYERSTPN